MDSLTQIVLGAGVAELMIGRRIGNKALLIGAIAGTIPDLDVVFSIGVKDPIQQIMTHRSYSHSMFTHIVLAFPLAWMTWKIWKKNIEYASWYWVWFMGLFTHALLDSCTTYGTRLFLPFTDYLVGLNNISIIDPLYTLPFMILLIILMFYRRNNPVRRKIAIAAITISSLYMTLTFGAKYIAHQKFTSELKRQNISYTELSTSPTILNAVLWAGMAWSKDTLYVGEYALAQNKKEIDFLAVPRNREAIEAYPDKKNMKVLEWFSQGKNAAVIGEGDTLHYITAKWGRTNYKEKETLPAFLFYYTLYKDSNGVQKVAAVDPGKKMDVKQAFADLWDRIWNW
jgi:inner membrane protein